MTGLNPVQAETDPHREVVQDNNVDPDNQAPVAGLNPERPELELDDTGK